MQRTQPNPNATTITPVTITENISCCTRTTKIALAIFASLAAFVFLPFGIAITLSAIVTLGAICCNDDDPTPAAPPQSQSSSGVSAGSGAPSAVGSKQLFERIEPTSTTKIMRDILTSDGKFAHITEAQREAFIGSFHPQSSADNLAAARALCSSSASIALKASGISGDEIPNCLTQYRVSSPSGVGMKGNEDMPDLSAQESSSSASSVNVGQLPKPKEVKVFRDSVAVSYRSMEDRDKFMKGVSGIFFRQYDVQLDYDLPSFDIRPDTIRERDLTLDDIVTELQHVYGDDLNITYSKPKLSPANDQSSSSPQEVHPLGSVEVVPIARPKPTEILDTNGTLYLTFSTEQELYAFMNSSKEYMGQYSHHVDTDEYRVLEIEYSKITDSGTVISQLESLCGKGLNITRA